MIFAEGSAEAWFLERWLESTGRDPNDIAVICFAGQKNLAPTFRALVEEENFSGVTRLGFFLDAETNRAVAVADRIRQILEHNDIISAGRRINPGVVFNDRGRDIVIYVSPDNNAPGIVEQVVLNEIWAHEYSGCIEMFQDAIVGIGRTPFPKSLVSAFLGIYEAGLCGTQHGFSKRYLDVMHEAYEPIRTTLGNII